MEEREEREERNRPEKNRGRRNTRRTEEPVDTGERAAGEGFLPKDDLSRFLAIKPYLSPKGRAIVDLLEELDQKGINRLDPGILLRLLGLFGGETTQNLASLGPLLNNLATPGGKIDPAALVSLLGTLAQTNTTRQENKKEGAERG
ncbi:MAG: hypothetical protein GX493_11790 [Firmicutes bacterium]|nr:hypothetical protein [Bacillota bacterium]